MLAIRNCLPFFVGVSLFIGLDASAETTVSVHASAAPSAFDLQHKPLERIEAGIVIGQEKSAGYSDLLTLVHPRLAAGYVSSLPDYAKRYASMFKLTVLANVTQQQNGQRKLYVLDKVGIGFSMNINGKMVVVV